MWVLKAILGRSNLNAAGFSKLTSANGMTLLAKGEEELKKTSGPLREGSAISSQNSSQRRLATPRSQSRRMLLA